MFNSFVQQNEKKSNLNTSKEKDAKLKQNSSQAISHFKKYSKLIDQLLPLSVQQLGIWFESELNPKSCKYNIVYHYNIRGRLSVKKLKNALHALTLKHPKLRAFILETQGKTYQAILKNQVTRVLYYDLSSLSLHQKTKEINKHIDYHVRSPFDLREPPLFRYTCLKISRGQYKLILSWHHLFSDAFSGQILIQDLANAYNFDSIMVSKLTLQQSPSLSEEEMSFGLEYWNRCLSGLKPEVTFPKSSAHNLISTQQKGQRLLCSLSRDLSLSLLRVAKETQATLFEVFLSALVLTLSKYCHQEDLAVGYTVSLRDQNLTNEVGYFINTIPFRWQVNEEKTIYELIKDVSAQRKEDRRFQNIPYSKILQMFRSQSQNKTCKSLFNVLLNQAAYRANLNLSGLQVDQKFINCADVDSNYEVVIFFTKADEQIELVIEYQSDCLFKPYIESLLSSIKQVFEQFVKNLKSSINTIEFLNKEAQIQLISSWNQANRPQVSELILHRCFELQVQKTPHQFAIICKNSRITYQELNDRSNQLAHYLRQLGVGPEKLVAVALERSPEIIITFLAILKAGGAYVPLDVNAPLERILFILKDTQATVLVTSTTCRVDLSRRDLLDDVDSFCKKICLDQRKEEISLFPKSDILTSIKEDNLAYVIYTSGSTGQPKGVLIEHSAIAKRLEWLKKSHPLSLEDRLLHQFSFCFDGAVVSTWWPLISGATLVIPKEEEFYQPRELQSLIRANQITTLFTTPSLLQIMFEEFSDQSPLFLRLVIAGGERLTSQLLMVLEKNVPQVSNFYGPTECTVMATAWMADFDVGSVKEDVKMVFDPPIGKPIDHTIIYLLDKKGFPVPLGMPGEICIGGECLARGYLNREKLNHEKFIQNPFSTPEDQALNRNLRLYRTGDLARYRLDGNLEFLGRQDQQIKFRGFRIEKEEIEFSIRKVTGASEVAVVMREEPSQIIGYFVQPQKNLKVQKSECQNYYILKDDNLKIKQAMRRILPEYMIPSYFVHLEKFPLTIQGKIDYKALPQVKIEDLKSEKDPQLPKNSIEAQLAEIWSQLLKLPTETQIGGLDDFFHLGGHSLLATQLISKVQNLFQVHLTLQEVFETPILADQAKLILDRKKLSHQFSSEIPNVSTSNKFSTYPLSFAQERMWFLDQIIVDKSAYLVPIAILIKGNLNEEALRRAFFQIYYRHSLLRSRFIEESGQIVQVITQDSSFPIEKLKFPQDQLIQLDRIAYKNWVKDQIEIESRKPFNLSKDLLIRVKLLECCQGCLSCLGEKYLMLTQHHMITDGWSIEILFTELSEFYRSFCQNEKPKIEPLHIQYVDFSYWQRNTHKNLETEQHKRYWKNQFADGIHFLNLPTDFPRPRQFSYRGSFHSIKTEAGLLDQLKEFCTKNDVTLFMVLLCFVKVILFKYSNQKDIIIGVPVANREHPDLQSMLGLFINTIPIRTRCEGHLAFLKYLKSVKKTVLEAYAHQEYPIDQLIQELKLPQQLSYHPLFQVLFDLEIKQTQVDLYQLSTEVVPFSSGTAKFDLTISARGDFDRLVLNFEYSQDLFLHSTVVRMADHFIELMKNLMKDPQCEIGTANILPALERENLIKSWNQHERTYPKNRLLHELIHEATMQYPDRIAIVCDSGSVTYQSLNEKSDQLACYLIKKGARPESVIGISLESSPKLLITLLAVLKAGCIFLPLDPKYPEKHLENIFQRANPSLVIVDSTDAQKFNHMDEFQGKVIQLDLEKLSPESKVDVKVQPSQLAYIIFTSGSTGMPKGIMIEHRSISNRLLALSDVYHLTPEDRMIQMSSYCFDASFEEIFLPLVVGAQVVIPPPGVKYDIPQLIRTINKYQVTTLVAVPSFLQVIMETLDSQNDLKWAALKRIISGGEELSVALAKNCLRHLHGDLFNTYGPTENTIDSTYWKINSNAWQTETNCGLSVIPIGKPIPDTQVYVLDSNLNPTPIGVPGDLYVGGIGVARGYLNRPDLDSTYFITDPFSSEAENRLYKTGDRAKWTEQGELIYLGREDHQVKLRGFRIELGAIEAVIRSDSQVHECRVLLREDVPGKKGLAAYLVLNHSEISSDLRLEAIQRHLANVLPEYMMPSAWMILDQLPLNLNGKIDDIQLPIPPQGSELVSETSIQPRNPAEEKMAQIWKRIFNTDKIGIRDSFFKIGGHSLLAARLALQIKREFGEEISMRKIFEFPTIEALTIELKKAKIGSQGSQAELDTEVKQGMELFHRMILESQIEDTQAVSPRQDIFLTGATGFLGAFLLASLLESTQNHQIYCLVRAQNQREALSRIRSKMIEVQLWKPEYEARIAPRVGDLGKSKLGLSLEDYQEIVQNTDMIIHNGAVVNSVYDYTDLKQENVSSTLEMMVLAQTMRRKKLHYISTLSVFPQSSITGKSDMTYFEDSQLDFKDLVQGGYAQSKWVSEKLLLQARDYGIPINIYRLGRIGGDSITGIWNKNDFVFQLIQGCIQLGKYPKITMSVDLAPVNWASQVITDIAAKSHILNEAFHIQNSQPVPFKTMIQVVQTRLGKPLQEVPYSEWMKSLIEERNSECTNVLQSIFELLPSVEAMENWSSKVYFDMTHTNSILSKMNLHWNLELDNLLPLQIDFLLTTMGHSSI